MAKKKVNACRKGKSAERELAALLRSFGFVSARRTEQHCGKAGDADVVADELPNLHIECTAVKGMDVGTVLMERAIEQAHRDAPEGRTPVVFWKKHNVGWRVSVRIPGSYIFTTTPTEELLRDINDSTIIWLNR